jgi:putative ABC transport system permease protein
MILGVFISTFGLSSIIIVSNGTKYEIINVLKNFGFGYDSILILAGPGKLFSHQRYRTTTLKISDAFEIERADFVKGVSPFSRKFSIKANFQDSYYNIDLFGAYPQFYKLHDYPILYGRFLNMDDIKKKAKVCIIGKTAVEKLFKSKNMNQVGKFIRIKNLYFKVVGVYMPKGSSRRFDIDRRVFIPLSTYNDILFHYDYIMGMKVVVNDTKNIDRYITFIKNILRKRHNLKENQIDDFRIITSKDIISFVNRSTNQLTKLLIGVSIISFIVSGLTILNIMLTTVFKRMNEIGIRRACGATRADIVKQFLSESIVTALVGGVLGLLVSILTLKLLSMKFHIKTLITFEPFLVSILFGIIVGVVFGFIPAYRASKIDPVKVLNG